MTIIDTIKDTHRSSLTSVRFSAIERHKAPDSASEYIVFLHWESSAGKYQTLMPAYFVPVEAGWVRWAALNTLGLPDVAPVSAVLEALRSLSAQH